jgi:hypothetical protein
VIDKLPAKASSDMLQVTLADSGSHDEDDKTLIPSPTAIKLNLFSVQDLKRQFSSGEDQDSGPGSQQQA